MDRLNHLMRQQPDLGRKEFVTLLSDSVKGERHDVDGGVAWELSPQISTYRYVHTLYPPLDEERLAYCKDCYDNIGEYLDYLMLFNGCTLFNGLLHLNGSVVRTTTLGGPVGLDYGNVVERPRYLSKEDFVFGSYAGDRSTISLALSPGGKITAWDDQSAAFTREWPSLAVMLRTEIKRLGAVDWARPVALEPLMPFLPGV